MPKGIKSPLRPLTPKQQREVVARDFELFRAIAYRRDADPQWFADLDPAVRVAAALAERLDGDGRQVQCSPA
jgi:hypothetical protein